MEIIKLENNEVVIRFTDIVSCVKLIQKLAGAVRKMRRGELEVVVKLND